MANTHRHRTFLSAAAYLLAGLGIFGALYFVGRQGREGYLLYHMLVEMFSVVVACAIWLITVNARRHITNDCFVILGVAFLFIAGIDMFHTLAYEGMNLLYWVEGANPATQLWVAGRYMQAISMLAAMLFLGRRLRLSTVLLVYAASTGLLLASIWLNVFPTCFVAGQGLTPFKVASEYVIMAIFLAALVLLIYRRMSFSPVVLAWLGASIVTIILTELLFTLYAGPFDIWNMLGHYFKLLSFYLLYKAIVETGLRRPQDLLFRELKISEGRLRRAMSELEDHVDRLSRETQERRAAEEQVRQLNQELEQRVALRTAEAEQRALQVRKVARELASAEQRERQRLAEVLHDSLQQVLVSTKMQLTVAANNAADPKLRKNLDRVSDLLSESVQITRSLSAELSPRVLREEGLYKALLWLADQMAQRHGLHVEVLAENDWKEPAEEAAMALYQSVRELLFNVVKHAGTSQAEVRLSRLDGQVRVLVADQGKGMDIESVLATTKGTGLASIRDRVELIGGNMELNSSPGQGAQFILTVPLA